MKIRVAVAQIKPLLGAIEANYKIVIENIEKAIDNGADIIVFPELALTGYFLKDMVPVAASWRKYKTEFHKILELSKHISIIIGSVEESERHLFYNSAFYIEDGEIKNVHRKVYLPTYGMFDEYRYFAKGDSFKAFDTKYGRFGILICEDAWHASSMYILSQDGADYIFVMSSSPSRGVDEEDTLASIKSWESINRFYSSMFSVYTIYANRTGYEDGVNFWGGSEVIDPFGVPEVKAPYFDEALIYCDMEKQKVRRARIYSPILKDEDINITLKELERIKRK